MKILKLKLDYQNGPLWRDVFDREKLVVTTGVGVVDNDAIAAEIDEKIQAMFASYYEFDSHGQACWFNSEQAKKDKGKMLELISLLKKRLEEINDGSFSVVDEVTEFVASL
ncbi:MAG: hypothetical protein K6B43_04785 [Treponema sp.]|nr:hypothetical protein [Treponema sp.]